MASVSPEHFQLVPDRPLPSLEIVLEPDARRNDGGLVNLGWEVPLGFTAIGSLRGNRNESVGGWRFGFIQLKHTSLDWAVYRGATPQDGSVFSSWHNRAVRPETLCRDSYASEGIFYNRPVTTSALGSLPTDSSLELESGMALPANGALDIILSMSDSPSRQRRLKVPNTSLNPPRDNYLHSFESRAGFIVLFAAQAPDRGWQILKHCYWNVHWQARLSRNETGTFRMSSVRREVNVQTRVHSGAPDDPRFRNHITDIRLPLCNPISRRAALDPRQFQYSPTWRNWIVSR